MEVLKFILILVEVLILFNVLIFVHELGHFLAARWRGLKIERFAIWFGKPIWKKRIGGVDYCMGSIPFGGYVALPQMGPAEMLEGQTETPAEELPPVSALDKIIVAVAGPLFSFLLALTFGVVVWMVGRPVSEAESSTVIGYLSEEGPAKTAGLQQGDRVLKVDGEPVSKFIGMGDSIQWQVVRSEGETIPVEVERGDQVLVFEVPPSFEETKAWQRKSLRQIEVGPSVSALVAEVFPNSPAAVAGLQEGDEVVSLDGQPIYHFADVGRHVRENPEDEITLGVKRGEELLKMRMTPEVPIEPPEADAAIGVAWLGRGKETLIYPGPIEQVVDSVAAMGQMFGALFSQKSDIGVQHLGGAVKILNIYYLLVKSPDGWRRALWFSVLINVNLALLNLLPIPMLDGGHVVLASIEAVRRKPVSLRVFQMVQTACALLLIGFMLFVTFYDAQDLKPAKEQAPPRFAPKTGGGEAR